MRLKQAMKSWFCWLDSLLTARSIKNSSVTIFIDDTRNNLNNKRLYFYYIMNKRLKLLYSTDKKQRFLCSLRTQEFYEPYVLLIWAIFLCVSFLSPLTICGMSLWLQCETWVSAMLAGALLMLFFTSNVFEVVGNEAQWYTMTELRTNF